MDKKGLVESTLVKVILILLVAGVLLYFTSNLFAETMKKSADPYVCRTQVALAASPKKVGLEPKDVECEVRNILENVKDNTEKQKSIITNEIYNCWWQYGEGKVDFMSNWKTEIEPEPTCFICSIITYVGSEGDYISRKDIINDLNKKKSNFGTELDKLWYPKAHGIFMIEKNPLYVTYMAYKYNGGFGALAERGWYDRIATFFTGGFFYKSEFSAYILVSNGESLKKACGEVIYPESYKHAII